MSGVKEVMVDEKVGLVKKVGEKESAVVTTTTLPEVVA